MTIAFWGAGVQSGTNANMRAVAAVFSDLCPDIRIGLYAAGGKGGGICRNKNYKSSNKAAGWKDSSALADIRFVDCGSGMSGEKRRILRKAEIVVVNIRQEEEEIRRFFLEESHLLPGSPILIGNYCGQSKFSRRYLECVYRAEPEKVSVLSRNVEFEQAAACGRVYRFVKKESCAPKNLRNQQLLEELKGISGLLLRNAETLYGRDVPWNKNIEKQ